MKTFDDWLEHRPIELDRTMLELRQLPVAIMCQEEPGLP